MKKNLAIFVLFACLSVNIWAQNSSPMGEYASNPGWGISKYYLLLDGNTFTYNKAHTNKFMTFKYRYDNEFLYIDLNDINGNTNKLPEELFITLSQNAPIPYKRNGDYLYLTLHGKEKKLQTRESKYSNAKDKGKKIAIGAAAVGAAVITFAAISSYDSDSDEDELVATKSEVNSLADKIYNTAW